MAQRKFKSTARFGSADSAQEVAIVTRYPGIVHHPNVKLHYAIPTFYKPDFLLGTWRNTKFIVYAEAKEWFDPQQLTKYITIIEQNTDVILVVIAKTISADSLHCLNKRDRIFAYRSYDVFPVELLMNIQPLEV